MLKGDSGVIPPRSQGLYGTRQAGAWLVAGMGIASALVVAGVIAWNRPDRQAATSEPFVPHSSHSPAQAPKASRDLLPTGHLEQRLVATRRVKSEEGEQDSGEASPLTQGKSATAPDMPSVPVVSDTESGQGSQADESAEKTKSPRILLKQARRQGQNGSQAEGIRAVEGFAAGL